MDRPAPPHPATTFRWRPRFTLRWKLALLSLLLLTLPWVGYRYVKEMERFLLESQQQALAATARAVATALHDRPQLMGVRTRANARSIVMAPEIGTTLLPGEELIEIPLAPLTPQGNTDPSTQAVAEIEAILQGLERTTSRIWVINRDLRVLALAGSLTPLPESGSPAGQHGWQGVWLRALNWLMPPPGEYLDESFEQDTLTSRREEVYEALMGAQASRVRKSHDGKIVIVSAGYPIWSGDRVLGAVVVEESTHSILSLRNQAIERLLLLTLLGFAAAALLVFGFASHLSSRIRKLRDEAESAIDAHGHIGTLSAGSQAGDEIGDLSRSFSALLNRLAQHHTYLESMASRLSHELRTPIAVVRSSLENLRLEPLPDSATTYMDRAETGLNRLSRILSRMSEATRMEQALAATESERFDLRPVVNECVNGYRMAYPARHFEATLPPYPVWVNGAPDVAAQMLDKLVENANDFALPGTTIHIGLAFATTTARLSVTNQGPLLPEQIEGRLFESMVSARPRDGGAEPHLGLGLYVARMIAAFHGGTLRATNLPDGSGVRFEAELKLA